MSCQLIDVNDQAAQVQRMPREPVSKGTFSTSYAQLNPVIISSSRIPFFTLHKDAAYFLDQPENILKALNLENLLC